MINAPSGDVALPFWCDLLDNKSPCSFLMFFDHLMNWSQND